jgi:hypothetical protein
MSVPKTISGAVFTAAFLAAFVSTLISQTALSGWKSTGKLTGLTLIAVTETQFRTTFTFKNTSGKVISAAAISFYGNGDAATNRYEDWFAEEQGGLSDGNTFDLDLGKEEAAEYNHKFEVSGVVFEDGTSQGSKYQLDFIRFGRLGKLLETERIRNVLAGAKGRFIGDEGIKMLMAEIGSSPQSEQEAIAAADKANPSDAALLELRQAQEGIRQSFFMSVQNTRIDMQKKMQELRKMPQKDSRALTQAAYLSELLQNYDTRSKTYRSVWERAQGGKRHE